jgi:hypothetical protein
MVCGTLVTCMHTVALRVISSARLYLAASASNPHYAVVAGVVDIAEWPDAPMALSPHGGHGR